MSVDKLDQAALGRDLQESAPQRQKRGWWRRNWRRLVLALLLLIVVIAGGAYWWLIGRVHQLEVYRQAMEAIAADKDVQKSLGQPIRSLNYPVPSARMEERETDVRWRIQGPKGHADAHLAARMMMGKWQTVILEVTLADNKKLSIRTADDTEGDAPPSPFGGTPKDPAGKKPEGTKPKPNAPAPNIDLPMPPDDPPGKP
jgi:hypothetical protein